MSFRQRFLQTQDKYWDIAGIIFGGVGCLAIFGQLLKELKLSGETSLSLSFVIGYVVVFVFWLFYGLRFKRPAIILTNAVCLLLQTALLLVITR
jgi:uncharacterized protein with PQ loop repeat